MLITVFMLLGSTYAWFTDSVSNTGNRIQAGTLDIDLLMAKKSNDGYLDYASIDGGQGDIFEEASEANNSNITLWEPGKTQWVYLAVQNKGNLALKYKFYLDVTDYGLCDNQNTSTENDSSLEYAILPGIQKGQLELVEDLTWDDIKARAAAVNAKNTGLVLANRNETADTGVMDEGQGETQYFALAVHMKEEAGNDYQDKYCIIDVSLVATQYTSELDGFGTNAYDAQGEYDTVEFAKKDVVKQVVDDEEDTIFTSPLTLQDANGTLNTTVTIPKEVVGFTNGSNAVLNIQADAVILANNTFTVGSDDNQEGAVGAIDLSAYVNDVNVSDFKDSNGNPVTVKVETYTAKNMTNVTLNYGSETWTQVPTEAEVAANKFYYEKATGRLVYGTTHFSTFTLGAAETSYIEATNTAYLKLDDAIAAAKTNEEIYLLKNIIIENEVCINKVISLDGGNHTISGKGYTEGDTYYAFGISGIKIVNIADTTGTINIRNFRITNIGNTNAIYVGDSDEGIAKTLQINISNISMDHLKRTGIGIYGGTFSIDKCEFDSTFIASEVDNQIQLGGWYIGNIREGTITNCTFTNSIDESNKWSSSGIAIFNGVNVIIDNCSFSNNTIAIATASENDSKIDAIIKNCSIKNCERGVFIDDAWAPCSGDNRIAITLEEGNHFICDEPVQIYKRYSTSKYILNITGGTYISKQCSANYAECMKPFVVYDNTLDEKTNDYLDVSIIGGKFINNNEDITTQYSENTYPYINTQCWYSNGSWNNGIGSTTEPYIAGYNNFYDLFIEGSISDGEGMKLLHNMDMLGGITCQLNSGSFYLYLQGYEFTNGTIKLNQGVSVICDTPGMSNLFSGGTISEVDNGNGTYTYSCN